MPLSNSSSSAANETMVLYNSIIIGITAVILSLVFLLGLPGNLFIAWSILARARRQSITTLLILNLAVADGSLMAITPFFVVYLALTSWVFGEVMCKVLFYLCLLNMYASIHFIALMSVHRMVAVLWPQRIHRYTGRRTVLMLLAATWALVMIASVPAMVFRRMAKTKDGAGCIAFHHERSHVATQYVLELVLGFITPYGVILFSYLRILKRIRKTRFGRRIRSEKLILAIVLTFFLFWLPYHIINMVHVAWAFCPAGPKKQLLGKIWQGGNAISSSIALMSSCANPVLYFFAGKSYIRREGLAFMARLFEGTGLDLANRKSRRSSLNSQEKVEGEDAAITLKG